MSKTILLADDSVTIQKVVELTFMDQDYEVDAVSDGTAALVKLVESKPDLLISDVHMPGANGYEVCRQAKEAYADVPVLLLVGTFEQFDEQEANSAGADSHLKKPFDSQDLLYQVESLISRSGQRADAAPAPAAAAAPAIESFAAPSAPSPTTIAAEAAPPVLELEPPVMELEPPALTEEPAPPAFESLAAEPPQAPDFATTAAATPFPLATEDPAPAAEDPAPAAEDLALAVEDPAPVAEDLAPAAEAAADPPPVFDFGITQPEPAEEPTAIWDQAPEESAAGTLEAEAPTEEAPFSLEPVADEEPVSILEEVEEVEETEVMPTLAAADPTPPEVEPILEQAAALAAPVEEVAAADEAAEDSAAAEDSKAAEDSAAAAEDSAAAAEDSASDSSPATSDNGHGGLSDGDVDRIAKRVVELMGHQTLRDVAWDVVPDLAEVIIKERIRELESQVE